MRADLDTLVVALYVTVDDLFGPRIGPSRRPELSDAELITLAVAQVLLGCTSERRWLRFAHCRLGHLFPYLPTQRYLPDQAPVIPTAHAPAALVARAGSGHRPVGVVVGRTEGSSEGRR